MKSKRAVLSKKVIANFISVSHHHISIITTVAIRNLIDIYLSEIKKSIKERVTINFGND